MARGVNKFIGIGNLCADPEQRGLPSGGLVTNIRIAMSESWKDRDTGEKKEKTEYITVSFFGKLAEIAAEYLRKGSSVYIEGKVRTRKWDDKDGNTRYTTEIVADEMLMLGGKSGSAPAQRSEPAPKTASFDDDIPFS